LSRRFFSPVYVRVIVSIFEHPLVFLADHVAILLQDDPILRQRSVLSVQSTSMAPKFWIELSP